MWLFASMILPFFSPGTIPLCMIRFRHVLSPRRLANTHLLSRLINLYSKLALAWSTPLFELYAVAPANTSRAALAQIANKVIQWVRREEERVFIIGGAVF